MSRSRERLTQMLTAARLALSYVDGMTKDEFLDDQRTQQAVVMNLLIISEAVARLMQDDAPLLATRPDMKWDLMRGMRNRTAHGYFEINMDVVWDTVCEALPHLSRELPAIIVSV